MNQTIQVTCECAPNIALIKYWGKESGKGQELILPLNSSLSVTLDKNVLNSKTSVVLLKETNKTHSKKIRIWFDDLIQEFNESPNELGENEKELISKKRFLSVLNKVRSNCELENPTEYQIRIKTTNNFPTACGLASSASGFACLAICLANAFRYKGDTSELARLGSGSACRSCSGGFVKWTASDDSTKSISKCLFSSNHWPEFNILALILEDERKKVSSTNGMQISTQTSDFLKYRVELVEEQRLPEIETAIQKKDFNKVGKIAIRESNSLHAVCLDTYPPLFYLNEKSKEIIQIINKFNLFEQTSPDDLKAFYSFDAGPNAFLFVLDEHRDELLYILYKLYFSEFLTELEYSEMLNNKSGLCFRVDSIDSNRRNILDNHFLPLKIISSTAQDSLIKYIIHSKVGQDPVALHNDWSQSLLNKDGLPV